MLIGSPTKSGTGILLEGDWYDLSQLYETIHRLAKYYDVPTTQIQYDQTLGLAYEVRKARDGMRKRRKTMEAGTYLGFQYTWPQLLSAVSLLRQCVRWHPAEPVDYGVLYSLEAQIKGALQAYDPEGAVGLLYHLEHGLDTQTQYLAILDEHVTLTFLAERGGKARFRNLSALLADYWNPMRPGHQQLVAHVGALAKAAGRPPQEFGVDSWPEEIKW